MRALHHVRGALHLGLRQRGADELDLARAGVGVLAGDGEDRAVVLRDEERAVVDLLEDNARALGLSRLFCLTFEVPFFSRRGFAEIGEQVVDPDVYSQLLRSPDEGVAEFLDLAHVKPNTLGNTRMLKQL